METTLQPLSHIAAGIAINKLRKLQGQWDFWYPQRVQWPLMPSNWHHEMAEKECMRLGAAIAQLKRDIAQYDEAHAEGR